MIQDIDMELAAAYRKLTDVAENRPMLRVEAQLIATQARGHLSEARRMLVEIERLGLGTGPLGDEP